MCLSFQKNKIEIYENLNKKSVVDNKLFLKTVEPLLSDKFACKDQIHLIENNEHRRGFKYFSSNIIENLDISRYSNNETLVSNAHDTTLKEILKYRNHSSTNAVQKNVKTWTY